MNICIFTTAIIAFIGTIDSIASAENHTDADTTAAQSPQTSQNNVRSPIRNNTAPVLEESDFTINLGNMGYHADFHEQKCYSEELCEQCQEDGNGNGCGCNGFSSSCGPNYSSYVCNKKYKHIPCEKQCTDDNLAMCAKMVKFRAGGNTPGYQEASKECQSCCDEMDCTSK